MLVIINYAAPSQIYLKQNKFSLCGAPVKLGFISLRRGKRRITFNHSETAGGNLKRTFRRLVLETEQEETNTKCKLKVWLNLSLQWGSFNGSVSLHRFAKQWQTDRRPRGHIHTFRIQWAILQSILTQTQLSVFSKAAIFCTTPRGSNIPG